MLSDDGLAQRYRFTWDGRDEDGTTVPPGTYLVQLQVSDHRGLRSQPEAITIEAVRVQSFQVGLFF